MLQDNVTPYAQPDSVTLERALVPGGEFHSTANDQRRKDSVLLLLMDGFSGRLVVGAMRHRNEYQRSHDDRQKQIEQNWTAAFSREHESFGCFLPVPVAGCRDSLSGPSFGRANNGTATESPCKI